MYSKLKLMGLGLFAVAIWAAIPAFVKIGSSADTLPFLLVLRFGIASIFFLGSLRTILTRVTKINLHLWLALIACLGANFYFQGLAMVDLPVSWYLIIFCLNPLFSLIFLGIRFNIKLIFGIVLSILGTLLFIDIEQIRFIYGIWPIIYITIGMFTWVIYTVLVKRFQLIYSNVEVTAVTQFCALLACLLIWIATGLNTFSLNSEAIIPVIALGVLTPLAYLGFTTCLKEMPKFGVVSQYLEPVFGLLIGYFIFKESLTNIQIAGSLMIIIGSVTVEC